jgi:hypothetical protein
LLVSVAVLIDAGSLMFPYYKVRNSADQVNTATDARAHAARLNPKKFD